ncbi:MAG: peptidoglycan-binding protein [Acidimicrobiia bacterium]
MTSGAGRGELPVLRAGSTDAAVRTLQQFLRARGFGVPDHEEGSFGIVTEAAVRGFQADRGIRVDGECGPETWAAVSDSGYQLGDRILCVRSPMLRGDDVGELQRRLNALGFDAGKEDAILGPNTERALLEFQRNAAITSDGICGRETIATLDRLGAFADGAVAAARERDALRTPGRLAGRRVYLAIGPGFEPVGSMLATHLRAAGAETMVDESSGEDSRTATFANDYAADLFLALRARGPADGERADAGTCRCCYYASGTFRSESGHAVAAAMADHLGAQLGLSGTTCGRAYTVLRETRMTAVVCEPVVDGDTDGIGRLTQQAEQVAAAAVRAIRSVLEPAAR